MLSEKIALDYDYCVVEFEKTPEICEKVFDYLIENYYCMQKSFSGEVIMQDDDSIIEAPHILSKIADNIIKFKTRDK